MQSQFHRSQAKSSNNKTALLLYVNIIPNNTRYLEIAHVNINSGIYCALHRSRGNLFGVLCYVLSGFNEHIHSRMS